MQQQILILKVAGNDMRKEEMNIAHENHNEAIDSLKQELSLVVKERDESTREVCRLRIDYERSLSLTARSQAQAAAAVLLSFKYNYHIFIHDC